MTNCYLLTTAWLVGSGMLTLEAAEDLKPLEIGNRTQLLVDDYVVARKEHVRRVLHSAKKENGGKPIFTDGRFYGTVLHLDGRFRMWWRKPDRTGFGYAESADGLHFRKVADVTGINFAGDYTLSVSFDPHETAPGHRFKAAYDAPGMRAGIAHSSDGIRWRPYNNGKPVTHRAADTCNQILWDEDAKTYRLFTRTDFGTAGGDGEIRGTRSMTNPDVKKDPANWKVVRNWVFDREGKDEHRRRQIYSVNDWVHHGVHFGLMSVYEWPGDTSEGPTDLKTRHERDVMNYYLATSRDGDQWDLQWIYANQPIVQRGGDGAFDKDLITPASTIVTHNDRHWLYYGGANERHGTPEVVFPREHAIGVATLRLDGFISLTAADRPAVVETKPFILTGDKLEMNVDAHQGQIRVDVLDTSGEPLEGFAGQYVRNINDLRFAPTWAGPLGELAGQTIRLRVHLRNASLYAFQIVSSAEKPDCD